MRLVIAALLTVLSFEGAARAAEAVDFAGGTLPLGGGVTTAATGTLPLMLPAHGTLPLSLRGSATAGGSAALDTAVVITSAQAASVSKPALPCALSGPNVTRHDASGSVSVAGSGYAIDGICYDADSKTMEIVGSDASGGRTSLASTLPNPAPTELNGRLSLTGTANAGHYLFDVKTP